jgi:hypothetical protein
LQPLATMTTIRMILSLMYTTGILVIVAIINTIRVIIVILIVMILLILWDLIIGRGNWQNKSSKLGVWYRDFCTIFVRLRTSFLFRGG